MPAARSSPGAEIRWRTAIPEPRGRFGGRRRGRPRRRPRRPMARAAALRLAAAGSPQSGRRGCWPAPGPPGRAGAAGGERTSLPRTPARGGCVECRRPPAGRCRSRAARCEGRRRAAPHRPRLSRSTGPRRLPAARAARWPAARRAPYEGEGRRRRCREGSAARRRLPSRRCARAARQRPVVPGGGRGLVARSLPREVAPPPARRRRSQPCGGSRSGNA